jgi:hypothetical protein
MHENAVCNWYQHSMAQLYLQMSTKTSGKNSAACKDDPNGNWCADSCSKGLLNNGEQDACLHMRLFKPTLHLCLKMRTGYGVDHVDHVHPTGWPVDQAVCRNHGVFGNAWNSAQK